MTCIIRIIILPTGTHLLLLLVFGLTELDHYCEEREDSYRKSVFDVVSVTRLNSFQRYIGYIFL